MTTISKTLAAAALATGLIAPIALGAGTASAAAPATIDFGAKASNQAKTGTALAGYFYRYRCFYVRYGYRVYRRCYVRYYRY